MWFLNHAISRETIEGKYVNESGVKTCSNIYDKDEAYIHSIIDKVLIWSEKRYARKEVINSGKIGFKKFGF